MKVGGKVEQIKDPEKMLAKAAQMEQESAHEYNLWANEASANADSMTKQLFESLVADEERHYDQYDVETDNLKKFGDRYLALQSIERSKNISQGKTVD
jgi:bacterioferritin